MAIIPVAAASVGRTAAPAEDRRREHPAKLGRDEVTETDEGDGTDQWELRSGSVGSVARSPSPRAVPESADRRAAV